MPRKRLTRDESHARTRERLLDAAARLFVAHGVAGASIDEIAAAAGYTKGAFYANFASKEDAFLALMERHSQNATEERRAMWETGADAKVIRASALKHLLTHAHQWDWLALGLEIKLAAARDPRARSKFAAQRRQAIEGPADEIRMLASALGRRPALDPALLCLALEALVEGLALLHRVDRESASQANVDAVLELFLDKVLIGS